MIPWTVALQAPLSMEFSRQEYWSGYPFPSPGDLPNSGIEPRSPALQVDSLSSDPPRKPRCQGFSKLNYMSNYDQKEVLYRWKSFCFICPSISMSSESMSMPNDVVVLIIVKMINLKKNSKNIPRVSYCIKTLL